MAQELGTDEYMKQNPQHDATQSLMAVTDILSMQLTNSVVQKVKETDIAIQQNKTNRAPQDARTAIDAAYADAIAPDEEVIGRMPAGAKIIKTFGPTRVVTDPITREAVVVAPKAEYRAAVANAKQDDANVARQSHERASNPTKILDVHEEMARLHTLKGDEALKGAENLFISLNREIAKEKELIIQQAKQKSGYAEAEANYKLNLAADLQTGGMFTTMQSAQTNAAQRVLNASQDRYNAYVVSLTQSSTRIAELEGAKSTIATFEQRRAQQEIRAADRAVVEASQKEERQTRDRERYEKMSQRDQMKHNWTLERDAIRRLDQLEDANAREIARLTRLGITATTGDARQAAAFAERERIIEAKAAALRATVSSEQLLNFRLIYDHTGDDVKDMNTIVNRRDKDEDVEAVITADRTNIYALLASDVPGRRDKGLKIINGRDNLTNFGGSVKDLDNHPESEVTRAVKGVLKAAPSTEFLLKHMKDKQLISEEDRKNTANALLREDAKGRERIRQSLLQSAITAVVQPKLKASISSDVRNWKTSETTNGILTEALNKAPKNKEGKVSMNDFVDTVMGMEIKDGTGTVLTKDAKIVLLQRSVMVASQNANKSYLFPIDTLLGEQFSADIKARANVSWVYNMLRPPSNPAGASREDINAIQYPGMNLPAFHSGRSF